MRANRNLNKNNIKERAASALSAHQISARSAE